MTALLSLERISKSFGNVKVLDGVSLELAGGTVTAIAGENGAGKSTLMKIITGMYHADAGTLRVRGQVTQFRSTRESMNAGIAIIHQELNLLPALSVTANLFLGRERVDAVGQLKQREMHELASGWLAELGQHIDPSRRVSELSIAHQQMVEIARAISLDADLIIMDEPTDALTERESTMLFRTVARLKAAGKSILFISHRLNEIFEHCDQVLVLRDGVSVFFGPTDSLTEPQLIAKMVGRELADQYPYRRGRADTVAIETHHLVADGIDEVSFTAHAGEVVGFAGLVGAGRTELAKALFGVNRALAGDIEVFGTRVDIQSPRDAMAVGIAYVTEDRKFEGLIQIHSVGSNMSLSALPKFARRFGRVQRALEADNIARYIDRFAIKTDGPDAQVGLLSGGNQQKVSIAKSLMTHPKILILDEPTRGVDVGAKREIYELINELKDQGLCILLMSSDMPELLGISDRIVAMAAGQIIETFDRDQASQEAILTATVTVGAEKVHCL